MKTLTEFSGTLIRMAARAVAQARKSLPREAFTVRVKSPEPPEYPTAQPHDNRSSAPPEASADSPSDAADLESAYDAQSHVPASQEPKPEPWKPGEAGEQERDAPTDNDLQWRKEDAIAGQDLAGQGQDGPPAEPPPEAGKPEPPPPPPVGEEAETDAAKKALDEAVAKATGTSGERLERLRDALKAVGNQAERVRLVRVFPADEPVQGAKKIGDFLYMVDLMPQSMKQEFRTDERGGPRRGPRRPSGGGQKGKEGTLEGSFSMESVMQDRRNERGPGGGRRPGGAGGRGRPGGGGRGPGGGGRGPGGGGGRPGAGRPAKP
jgi:translation initiation factor IF-2